MVSKGIVVQEQDLGLYQGPIAVMTEDVGTPRLRWKGAKISRSLWKRIISFLVWSQKEFKSEAQLRLYYNETSHCWKALVLPQTIRTGLSSDEIAGHGNRSDILDKAPFDEGWRPAGTVHHHCHAGAFQSGTDFKDEIDQNGLHVTLGHMESAKLDFDGRATLRKVLYTVDWHDWFDMTEGELTATCDVKFPAYWKHQCFERQAPVYPKVSYPRHQSQGFGTYPYQYPYDAPGTQVPFRGTGFTTRGAGFTPTHTEWPARTDTPPVAVGRKARQQLVARTKQPDPDTFEVDLFADELDVIEYIQERTEFGIADGLKSSADTVAKLVELRGVMLLLGSKLEPLGFDLEGGLHALADVAGVVDNWSAAYLAGDLMLAARAYDAGARAEDEGRVFTIEEEDEDYCRNAASLSADDSDPSGEDYLDAWGRVGRERYGDGEDLHGTWGGDRSLADAFGHMS